MGCDHHGYCIPTDLKHSSQHPGTHNHRVRITSQIGYRFTINTSDRYRSNFRSANYNGIQALKPNNLRFLLKDCFCVTFPDFQDNHDHHYPDEPIARIIIKEFGRSAGQLHHLTPVQHQAVIKIKWYDVIQ